MGMIRGPRRRRLHPRRCPIRSPPLSPGHGALLDALAGEPDPQALPPAPLALLPEPPMEGVGAQPPQPPLPPPSLVHQNYSQECEAALNKHINLELHASYVYLSMAFYFDRQEVALKHFATFFLWQWREGWEQVQTLMRLQNQRGGHIRLSDIQRPDQSRWESGQMAMKHALQMERMVNQSLLNLFHLATVKNDAHLCNFLEHHHLRQDVRFIRNLAASVVNLRRLGAPEDSLAEYLFGKLTLGDSNN
ncbi:ferritin heavy chain-like [Artibeus jamaicensis]|uniref:ferritin heavy chain-like n=1 Tax=Artibeus jamaicensis TaxID=9417 RepID=UPI00235A4F1B|nr:ferritin heavy chain-like [Artibeus jamaicensis]